MKRPTPIQFGLTAAEHGAEHGHDAFKLAAALGVRVRIILYCPDDLIYVPSGTSSRPTVIFLSPERPVGVRNRILAVGLAHHVRECSHDEVYCWRIVSGELRDELACWTADRQWAQAFLGEPLPWGGGGAEGARGLRQISGRAQGSLV